MTLPTNRTTSNTAAEHVTDHNTLHTQHNELIGHLADSTAVHGITDTSALETTTGSQDKVDTHSADTTSVHGIADTSALETTTGAQSKVTTHAAVTENVHGIIDTADLETSDGAQSKVDTHANLDAGPHGSTVGASKIAKIVTPAGTGEYIYVDEESSPSTPVNVGDIRIVVPDGFF